MSKKLFIAITVMIVMLAFTATSMADMRASPAQKASDSFFYAPVSISEVPFYAPMNVNEVRSWAVAPPILSDVKAIAMIFPTEAMMAAWTAKNGGQTSFATRLNMWTDSLSPGTTSRQYETSDKWTSRLTVFSTGGADAKFESYGRLNSTTSIAQLKMADDRLRI